MTKSYLSILAIYVRPISTIFGLVLACITPSLAHAAVNIPLTVNLSETVTVTGTPRIAVDVGGTTRYATYTSGTGSNALTFTLAPQAGDVDLDGVTVSSPIDLNGGTITDVKGNNAALTFTPPGTTNVKVNYPSLGMDFVYDADGRYTLNGTVYNDLTSFLSATGGTFTRASIGTYFDSTGTLQTAASGVPRFDYDPVTHAAKGILIEESRTNYMVRSSELDHATWSKNAATVSANAAIAPDGTMTADKVIPTTANSNYRTVQQLSPSLTIGTTYLVTAYAKAAGYNYATIIVSANNGRATFDLTTGASTSYAVATTSTTYIGNGWWRLNFKFNSVVNGAPGVWVGAMSTYTDPYTGYTGDGSSGVYLWGIQFEQGSFPTSYIPTPTAAVTRAADALSIPVSGTWYGSSSGTTEAEFNLPNLATATGMSIFSLYTGSNNGYLLYKGSGTATLNAYANTNSLIMGTLSSTAIAKASISYDTLSAYTTFNGSSVSPLSNTTVSTPTTLLFAKNWFGNQMTGYLKKFKYYPTRISNTQLQLLTQ